MLPPKVTKSESNRKYYVATRKTKSDVYRNDELYDTLKKAYNSDLHTEIIMAKLRKDYPHLNLKEVKKKIPKRIYKERERRFKLWQVLKGMNADRFAFFKMKEHPKEV